MQYRRSDVKGGTFFFTVNLADRSHALLTENINLLRMVTRQVKSRHPFVIDAMVVLPDHLHAVWTLPEDDCNYPKRWSLIKSGFSRSIPPTEAISASRKQKRERGVWQRRFWEHQIRDETDFENHVNYIHNNPVKHGYVRRAVDWPYSSIHQYISNGKLSKNWAYDESCEANTVFGEKG